MSAIIRIKRRCDEEPVDALVLNSKRRKTEELTSKDEESLSAVLTFAGTIETQEEDIFTNIKKPGKTELEENYKRHLTDIKDKIREQIIESSKNNRYRVVSLHRSISENSQKESTVDVPITIVDIEANEEKKDEKESLKYVYDVYYTSSDDLGEVYEQDLIGIYPVNEELVFNSNDLDTDESDDSNDENNWRNDYPDEDDNSITEEDMTAAMNKMTLDPEEMLSSDDGEEGFVYSIDSEGAGFEEDIDDTDVNRYGERYARFKARYKEQQNIECYPDYDDEDTDPEFYD